jgi:hypothetical protein
MLEPLPDLPEGVIGFEAVGEVEKDDYTETLRPALDAAAEVGEIRLVYVLGERFTGYSAGASWEDLSLATHHLSAYERTALVSDHEWLNHAASGFGWMMPGKLKVFPLAERAEAIAWAADD